MSSTPLSSKANPRQLTLESTSSPVAAVPEKPLKKRLNSLQSMRLAASLAVFQYHLWGNYLGQPFLHPGTDFFIVLVGMVAALSDADKIVQGEWKKYILGRYLRLYVTFIPVFLLYILAGRDEITPVFLIKSFFFIPLSGDRLPLVGPTWMLAMFLIFYWLFSLAFLFRRETSLIPIFSVWGGGCVLIRGFALHSPVFDEGFQMLFSIRNLEFIAGYAAGWLVRTGRISGTWGGKLMGAGLLLLLASVQWSCKPGTSRCKQCQYVDGDSPLAGMARWRLLCTVPDTQCSLADLGYDFATDALACATCYPSWPASSSTRLPILGKTCTGIPTPQMVGEITGQMKGTPAGERNHT
jgi:hypothetical protein